MPSNLEKVGRIALRVEGKWWVAYFAANDTMANALPLSRVKASLASRPKIREAFLTLNRTILDEAFADVLGVKPDWKDPERAPEHERSGNA